jgi:ribonuclease E
MKKEMLINVLQPEECRIAIVEDGILEELYVERTSHESYVGNIYKGRIVNIEPSIQAAFVDFGVGRNGFLHVSDVEPAYYRHLEERRDRGGYRQGGRDRHRSRPMEEDDDYSRRAPSRRPEPQSDEPEGRGEERGPRRDDRGEERGPRRDDRGEERGPRRDDRGEERGEERGGRGGKRRRGRRGRGRGRQNQGAPETAEGMPPSEATPESGGQPEMSHESHEPPEFDRDAPPPHDDGPRPMESAERRTDEDDPPSEPVEPRGGGENVDDLLFFPSQPESPSHREAPVESRPTHHEHVEERPSHAHRESPRQPVSAHEDDSPFGAGILSESESEPMRLEDTAENPDEVFDSGLVEEPMTEEHVEEFGEEHELAFERTESEFDEEGPSRPRRRDDRRGGPRGRGGRRQGRDAGRNGFGRPKPLIQDIFKRGQEVLVQVIKEGIGTKGPTLSTYISIAGRYLVLMPGLNRIGVSRKIADEEQRRRLRDVLNELKPPKGVGFIIRTAGMEQSRKELQNDLAYLSRLWEVVVKRIQKTKSPAEIYQESDMITRTIRDTFTNDIDTIWVDEQAAFEHAQEFLKIVMPPRYANRIKQYTDLEPLFHKYGIEQEIARIHQRHVPLAHGGSIVIDQTEALVAIDVNSGNFRADNNAEETAYQMNLQAAKEIARQLRLRDLGGVIVNDFIDMRDEKHRRGVEKAMRDAVKRDRARTKVLKISQFGMIEMTRQRIRPSLKRSVYQDCVHCKGTGQVKTCESMSIDVMRLLQLAAHRERIHRVDIRVTEEVANYLLNKKRKEIAKLEESGELQVHITGRTGAPPEMLEFICTDNNNNEVKFLPAPEETRPRRR